MEEYKKMESSRICCIEKILDEHPEYYLDEFVDPYSILPLFGG
jgi:hypothetical protein